MADPEPQRLCLDFGDGKLAAVPCDGRSWVRFDDLVRFLGGDREVLLAETLDSSFADKLVTSPDGTLLLPWDGIPQWMFVPTTNAIAPEHRDGHTAWCRAFLKSGACRRLGEQAVRDLGIEMIDLD